jgi:hypothetical protein
MRMLVRLWLDPARKKLLTGFFEAYLKLNKREEEQLKIELTRGGGRQNYGINHIMA